MKKREYLTEDGTSYFSDWFKVYKGWNFGLRVQKAGYFDERPEIFWSVSQMITLPLFITGLFFSWWALLLIPALFVGYGQVYWYLPIKTGIQDCTSAEWGLNYHDNRIWIGIGGGGNYEGGAKFKTITMPWDLTWVRTSTLLQGGKDWFNETKDNRKSWKEDINGETVGSYEWLKKNKWQETHEYLDKFDNSKVNATISVVEREWRPLWFQWTNLLAKKRRSLSIDFDKEVGKQKGSWKGGCVGCSYDLREDETPLECLRRMEIEREF